MQTPERQIIELLAAYQDRNKLHDYEMAKQLGIAASSWSMFRRHKRSIPRPGILSGFAQLFERQKALLHRFLTDDTQDTARP